MKLLEQFGNMAELYDNITQNVSISRRFLFNFSQLRQDGKLNEIIDYIEKLLADLRNYWKNMHK